MKQVTTKDNSVTFHNPLFDEHYHSVSGAREEAIKKYVEPCKIQDLAKTHDEINILDICFGLGYNSAAAIDAIKETNPDCRINIIALENDPVIIEMIQTIDYPFQCAEIFAELAETNEYNDKNVHIQLIMGDALQSIQDIDIKFDAIFLDPFSPKKCPDLWTEEFFKDIYALTKPKAILATYSCARAIRENLIAAGFKVKDGPFVGRYAPSTIATI